MKLKKKICKVIACLLCGLFCFQFVGCSEVEMLNRLGNETIELPEIFEEESQEQSQFNNLNKVIPSCEIIMPTITIIGCFDELDANNKDKEVMVEIKYKDDKKEFESGATFKFQGASSLGYQKKNYTMKLIDKETGKKNKVKIVDAWGKQNKYCLKANYIDYSQARNVVSAKIYGQIASTRVSIDEYSELINGGAIDGFPVVLMYNDEFLGLYTMNIPKDEKFLFNMDTDEVNQAILMGDSWTDSVALKTNITGCFSSENIWVDGWELEYCSTDDYSWVSESFNNLINFLNTETDELTFKSQITNYINIDRTIDTMLYTMFVEALDNVSKNILWTTYDGVVWTPCIYDMDDSWGLVWDGKSFYNPSDFLPDSLKNSNALWNKIYEYYFDEIKSRYFELRTNVLTFENIAKTFIEFDDMIQKEVKTFETDKWKDVPSQEFNNIGQILSFTLKRLTVFDEFFNN